MKNLRTKLAAVVIAAAAMIAAPISAQADPYPPEGEVSGPATLAPGGSGVYSFGGFQPGEQVQFTLTGENVTDASLASITLAAGLESTTEVNQAGADGVADATVTLPANAVGTYTLTAVGLGSGETSTTTITVGSAAAVGGSGSDRSGLPNTGGDPASLAGIWIGGGALLAAGAALAGVTLVRRRQSHDA